MVRSLFFFGLLMLAGFIATDLLSIALEQRAIAERPADHAPVHDGSPANTRDM